jgi:hypothetical protein
LKKAKIEGQTLDTMVPEMKISRCRPTIIIIIIILFISELYVGRLRTSLFSDAKSESQMATLISNDEMMSICNETISIAVQVYNTKSMLNHSEHKWWVQEIPTIHLECDQLIRSVQMISEHEMSPTLSLLRLSQKMGKLKKSAISPVDSAVDPFKIVVIGGSMSNGSVDFPKMLIRQLAWPHKLLNFMHHKWTDPGSVEIINLSMGGANEESWIGDIDRVVEQEPIDVILVESAVNDQCTFDEQALKENHVNRTSYRLLKALMNFPSKPAVFSIELFRTAYNNSKGAEIQCRNHVQELIDLSLNQSCFSCEQWWMPQDWRVSAREVNSVSFISYRDAVWPKKNHPPDNLCQYWSGLSHPMAGVHSMVATTILFTFLLVDRKRDALIEKYHRLEQRIKIESPSVDLGMCLQPESSYHAIQGNATDPINLHAISSTKSCWKFKKEDNEKYGWICEINRNSITSNSDHLHRLQKSIYIGKQKLVIISRLVSSDERMATAQIWFSASNSSNANIFNGDPVWNVTSLQSEKTSGSRPYSISLASLELKKWAGVHWEERLELVLNVQVLVGSSSNMRVDKFKLLGIVSC